MSESQRLVVATVNTYLGRAVLREGGLDALAHADVLLMQELFSPAGYQLEARLRGYGFDLLAVGGHFGLGIALKTSSAFRHVDTPARSIVLEQVGTVEHKLTNKFSKCELEYSDL